ncbi:MAG: hypothetical protein EXS09_13800 [Gemmataceae bacterium]|nr:hypothetical protein [Gemmataceae bacterium]
MKTAVRIVDYGRGPQLENNRLTVMDVFYYLHRGRDWDFIHMALPRLSRDEFDAVVDYVDEHRQELIEADERVEEFYRRGREEQTRKGLDGRLAGIESPEERYAILLKELHRQKALKAERNGDHAAR